MESPEGHIIVLPRRAQEASLAAGSPDAPSSPPTAPPSAPRSLVARSNGSAAALEWSEPLESGGRQDLRYTVTCRECPPGGAPCRPCRLRLLPGARDLAQTRVTALGLHPHLTYAFVVEATNGVSGLSPGAPHGEAINVTSGQDGETPTPQCPLLPTCSPLPPQPCYSRHAAPAQADIPSLLSPPSAAACLPCDTSLSLPHIHDPGVGRAARSPCAGL